MTGIEHTKRTQTSPVGLLPVLLPFLLAAPLWGFVLTGSGTGMSVWAMTKLALPPVSNMQNMQQAWSLNYAAHMILMWWAMMLAMMLLPVGLYGRASFSQSSLSSGMMFLIGFSGPWLLFAFAATSLQWQLERTGLFHPFMMWSLSKHLSAVLLMGAGAYQLSSAKTKSRAACHLDEVSLVSGLRFGINCLLSTAPLMLLLFASGAMNMIWMTGLTFVVLLERGLSDQRLFDRGLAFLFISLSIWSLTV